MIRVNIDMREATRQQIEDFFALPAVSAAFDCLTLHGPTFGISLSVLPRPSTEHVTDRTTEMQW